MTGFQLAILRIAAVSAAASISATAVATTPPAAAGGVGTSAVCWSCRGCMVSLASGRGLPPALSGLPLTDASRASGVVVGHEGLLAQRRPDVTALPSGRQYDRLRRQVLVGDHAQQVADAVQPRAPLVVGLHHVPGRLLGVGVGEHLVLGP